MTDPKPPKRIKDPLLMAELHWEWRHDPCHACHDRRGQELHHVKRRGQGGDDVRENLVWLCRWCHGSLHGNPYWREGERWDAARVKAALETRTAPKGR